MPENTWVPKIRKWKQQIRKLRYSEVPFGDVILLRRKALKELSAHELAEDRAANCFFLMCQDLSNKINAKLSRQQLD